MIYGSITKCYIVGHGQRNEWECRLGYQVVSENTETNTREILLQLEARSINRNYYATGYLLTPTIDGEELNPIPMNFSQANTNIWQVLGTKVINIVGAYNGIKYGSFITNLTDAWDLKSGSASVYIVLDNLHTPPQITGITIQETNELLNNASDIVQFLSVKNYKFDTTTFDDATISSYQVYHNGVLIGSSTENDLTIDYDSVGTLATFEMDNKIFAMLKFVVIDSYTTIGVAEVPYEVTTYVKPNLIKTSSSLKRNGQLSGKVKLSLVGTFFNQAINEIPNVINLQFKYWKKGVEEPSEYYDIPYEAIDNNINLFNWAMAINGEEIEDVDSNFAYNFKIKATDYFDKTSEIELLCPVGEYLWAEFKDRVDFKEITIKGVNPFKYYKEEVRIGTWMGKPLYRKMIEVVTPINATPKTYDVSNLNIETITDMRGIIGNGRPVNFSIIFGDTGTVYFISCYYENNTIYLTSHSAYGGISGYVIIEYTKNS